MTAAALAPVDLLGDAFCHRRGLVAVGVDGAVRSLDVARWCGPADAVDLDLLRRLRPPVLDIGCGPGRMVAALAARGVPVLGIDIAPAAVALAVATGGLALRRSVFDRLPGEGRWRSVLLLDDNVGIGGDPRALLARVREVAAPAALAVVEADADEAADERAVVRLQTTDGRRSAPFRWARLGTMALVRTAAAAGWHPVERWSAGGRSFVALEPA